MGYEVRIRDQKSMRLDTLKMIDCIAGYVVFVESDGKETDAKYVSTYEKTMYAEKQLRRKCNGVRLQFARHLKETGQRLEVIRKAEADAKRAAEREAARVLRAKRNAAEAMYDALQETLRFLDYTSDWTREDVLLVVRHALKKAEERDDGK
jgi:hypothetical protein